jgi:DNA polymerase elongation subunit (family B)
MRILTVDIETSPIDAYVWGLWQQNVYLPAIKKPTRMLSWCAKWYGEDEVMWASEHHHGAEDMVHAIYELVNEADAIVGWNSKNFDMKHLNREFIELELTPPTNYAHIDLLLTVRQNFKFPSNKLDYVAGALLGEHKLDTGGFGLWAACLQGDPEAWQKMVDYNIEDVLLTERMYDKLKGWIKNHPNWALYVEDQEKPVCRNCASEDIHKRGQEYDTTGVFAYQRYKCNSCGTNLRGRKSMKGSVKQSPQVLK